MLVTLSGSDNGLFTGNGASPAPGAAVHKVFRWTAPPDFQTIEWSLSVTAGTAGRVTRNTGNTPIQPTNLPLTRISHQDHGSRP